MKSIGAKTVQSRSRQLSNSRILTNIPIQSLTLSARPFENKFEVFLMTASVLGDRFGRRRLFAGGMVLFVVASAGCALAPSIGWLIAARAIQGDAPCPGRGDWHMAFYYYRNAAGLCSGPVLLVAGAAIVCLASVAYIREYLAKSELVSELGSANDRLRLAVEAGKSVGWEWDLKTGRLSWFGDLQTMFGIASDTFVGRMDDFFRYVHPEDRQTEGKAVADAREGRKPYAASPGQR